MGFASRLAWDRMANTLLCEPAAPRIFFEESAVVSAVTSTPDRTTSDLQHVEDLLERCWRELDTVDLNVKLTDLIRLLEFKHKLGPGQQAERLFWELIDEIRRDELSDFGNTPEPAGGRDNS